MTIKYTVKFKPPPRPKLCIIVTLEFVGIDDPSMPEGRVRQALSRIAEYLGDEDDLKKQYESRWSLAANRALTIATKREGMLPFRVILKVLHLQMALVPLGVLVCGAISLGEATSHDEIIIGKGVTIAERLREEVADVPRVIVDPAVLRAIETNPDLWALHHGPTDELGYIRQLLRQDSDSIWFVDYLQASRGEIDEFDDYVEYVRHHHNLVRRKLEACKNLNRDTRALTWLWQYHEQIVDYLDENWGAGTENEFDPLRIPATSPLLYRFPPSAIAPD